MPREIVKTEKNISSAKIMPSTLPDKQKQWLNQEVLSWRKNNIITERQTKEILGKYNISYGLPKEEPVNIIKVLSTIGAIILGLGIILFMASNWQKIPDTIKMMLFTLFTIASLSIAYYFSYSRTDYPNLGKSLFLLSALIYGAALLQIAQIYHSNANAHWLILMWALSIIPLTYFFNSLPLYIFNTILFIIWNGFYYTSESSPNYLYPLIVFLILIPMIWKKEEYYNIINIVAIGIAQLFALIFALTNKQHWLLLVWALGSIIYYFITKKELYLIMFSAIQFLWCISFFSVYDKIPNYWFIAVLVLLYYLAYLENSAATFTITSISFILWVNLFVSTLAELVILDKLSFVGFLFMNLMLCLSLYQIGVWLKNKLVQSFSVILRLLGFIGIVITTYLLSFKSILSSNSQNGIMAIEYNLLLFTSLFFAFVFFIFLIGNIKEKMFSLPASKLELCMFLGIIIFSLFVLLVPQNLILNIYLMNMIIFALAFAVLFYGFETKEPVLFNLGILFFIIFIITRYFDILWNLLNGYLFFMIGGIIMLAGSIFLEKLRRKTIDEMKLK